MKEQGKERSSIVLWMKWQFGHFLKGKHDLVGKRDQEKQGAHFKGSTKRRGHVPRATVTCVLGAESFYRDASGEEKLRWGSAGPKNLGCVLYRLHRKNGESEPFWNLRMNDLSLLLDREKRIIFIIKDEFKGPKREDEGNPFLREAIILDPVKRRPD